MKIQKNCLISVGFALFLTGTSSSAEEGQVPANEGPNGGRLLEHDGLSIEVTIFESGIPPEMRLYSYSRDGELIQPSEISATAYLKRLGGETDKMTFLPESDYLVGQTIVREPHSYDVRIEAEYQAKRFDWEYESHEGRAKLTDRLIGLSGLTTEPAGNRNLTLTEQLFGIVAVPTNRQYRVAAPYAGLVRSIEVSIGDRVTKGQLLATLFNRATAQEYELKSPAEGEVTKIYKNVGDTADLTPLLEVVDLSRVWIEMSAFPESIENLELSQKVVVSDLHDHERSTGELTYIAPVMTGGHIARARAEIDNPGGQWRPGMHVLANITVDSPEVALAVREEAIQLFRGMEVVFAKFGNQFEVRMIERGRGDGTYVEVLGGLKRGTEYVIENSFLLKADVLKDGASHDH